jgi:3-oxoadipate enol-lactonase
MAAVALFALTAGSGFPLVLIHGLGSSSADWEEQIPAFSSTRRVVAPDLRGYGRSPKASPYSVETFAADVWALLDRLAVREFDLIGHSMGGAVALQMAVDRPARLRRLVLSSTLPSFRADTLTRKAMFVYRYLMMSLLGPGRLTAAITQRLFPDPDQEALRRRLIARNSNNDRSVYLQTIRGLVGWSVLERLDRLVMPTLLLAGEHDYFSREELDAFFARLPNARLHVFAGGRHAVLQASPALYNASVLEFLDAPLADGR